jgi:hypothetical protein
MSRACPRCPEGVRLVDVGGGQARRDVCRVCDQSTKSVDPKFKAFGGLTSKSICRRNNQPVASFTIMAGSSCPDGRWMAAGE